jgi:glycerol kinase
MALDKSGLVVALKAIRNIDISGGDLENDEVMQAFADAIDIFVKSGDVVVSGGSSAGSYKVT